MPDSAKYETYPCPHMTSETCTICQELALAVALIAELVERPDSLTVGRARAFLRSYEK